MRAGRDRQVAYACVNVCLVSVYVCVNQVALRGAEQHLEAMAIAERLPPPGAVVGNIQIQVNDVVI